MTGTQKCYCLPFLPKCCLNICYSMLVLGVHCEDTHVFWPVIHVNLFLHFIIRIQKSEETAVHKTAQCESSRADVTALWGAGEAPDSKVVGKAVNLEGHREVGDDQVCKSLHRSTQADVLICIKQQREYVDLYFREINIKLTGCAVKRKLLSYISRFKNLSKMCLQSVWSQAYFSVR